MLWTLTESDITAIVDRPKFWHGALDWNENPPGSVLLVARGMPTDLEDAVAWRDRNLDPSLRKEIRQCERTDRSRALGEFRTARRHGKQ